MKLSYEFELTWMGNCLGSHFVGDFFRLSFVFFSAFLFQGLKQEGRKEGRAEGRKEGRKAGRK